MIEGGKTPVLPQEQLAALGFQLILYPLAGLFAAAKPIRSIYEEAPADGTTSGSESQMSFAEFNRLIGVGGEIRLGEEVRRILIEPLLIGSIPI